MTKPIFISPIISDSTGAKVELSQSERAMQGSGGYLAIYHPYVCHMMDRRTGPRFTGHMVSLIPSQPARPAGHSSPSPSSSSSASSLCPTLLIMR